MQVMPSDDFSDDVIHITSTTPINRDSTPLIHNQPRKWLFFCRSVIIYVASQWIAMHIDWMHFQLFIQYVCYTRVFNQFSIAAILKFGWLYTQGLHLTWIINIKNGRAIHRWFDILIWSNRLKFDWPLFIINSFL